MSQHEAASSHRYRYELERKSVRSASGTFVNVALLKGLAAAAGLTVTLIAADAAKGSPTWRRALSIAQTDTVWAGDRRCLTRRPEDCLAQPVPVDEPHGAVCSVCHDLWGGERPLAQTVRPCSGSGCHTSPETLTPFHRTVDRATLQRCIECHKPHDFRVVGGSRQCGACHETGGAVADWAAPPALLTLASRLRFDHDRHASVACVACHGEGPAHSTLRVRSTNDCRSCHHRPPVSSECTRCHVIDEVRSISVEVTRRLDIHVGSLDGPRRTIRFDHAEHWNTDCVVCHTGGTDLGTASGADCSGCHFQHHDAAADCSACHEAPAPGAHTRAVHAGCAGTGCHDRLPEGIRGVPHTRQLCLACHRDEVEHEPGRSCSDCHALPPAGPACQ